MNACVMDLDGPIVMLMGYEFEALLSALRRDLRRERATEGCNDEEEEQRHGQNARMDVRLLEVLQPKQVVAALVNLARAGMPAQTGLSLVVNQS